ALVIVVPLMAAIGYALQRGILNQTLGPDLLPPLLVTFGLSVIIQNGLLELFTADSRKLQAGPIEVASIQVGGGIAVGTLPLIQFVVALIVIAGLQFMFYRTAIGRAFRAASDDPAVARLVGLDNAHVFGLAMAVSLAVVAIAGVFLAVRANFDPAIGPARLIFGFEAVIMGGLGSMWGTLAGRVILWGAQAVGAQVRPGRAGPPRPHRLPGRARGAARRPVPENPDMNAPQQEFHVAHATRSSRIGAAVLATAVVVLAAAPAWGGRQELRLLAEIFSYVTLASLWNLLAGYAGLVSVGQQAYVGLGAYVLFALTMLAGLSALPAIALAGVIGAVVSAPVAGLIFRLRGHYFAIGTWVVAEVFRLFASQVSALGGGSGISLPVGIVTSIGSSRQEREFII